MQAMIPPLKALSDLVKEVGTQKAAAKKLGITEQYVGQLLRDQDRAPMTEGIAEKLGYRLDSKWIKITK